MRGHIPPKPGFGKQVSSFMGRRLPPGGGESPPVGGKKAVISVPSAARPSAAGPFGRTNPAPSNSSFIPGHAGFGGKSRTRGLPGLNTGKKSADGGNYQHADYATGFRALGAANHDHLHPSVRPTNSKGGVGAKGDKATGPATGKKALLPQELGKKGKPNVNRTYPT